jgi:hypothetical protein
MIDICGVATPRCARIIWGASAPPKHKQQSKIARNSSNWRQIYKEIKHLERGFG